MENKTYPDDQAQVFFRDNEGANHEGRYVLSMNAFVEIKKGEDPEDCSNVYPQENIIQWEYIERSDMDGGLIEAF